MCIKTLISNSNDYFPAQRIISIHPRVTRESKRTYFCLKSFLLEANHHHHIAYDQRSSTRGSPETILKLCAQCPRRHGTKGPSCSSINRPDEIPRGHAARYTPSKSWKPEDSIEIANGGSPSTNRDYEFMEVAS